MVNLQHSDPLIVITGSIIMEKVQWKVEGMDCNTCAINIHRYLEKQGMKNVKVNFATGM